MRDKGVAHIGIGRASGDNKAVDAIKSAMDSPLLETTVSGASDIIVNFSGNIGIVEAYDAITYLTEVAGDGANIIFGTVDNDVMGEDVCITIIATGIEDNAATQPVMQNPAKPSAVKPTVAPVGKTPTYASQPITSVKPMGTATKPSFMSTPAAKPSVSADISSAAKPAPAKRENRQWRRNQDSRFPQAWISKQELKGLLYCMCNSPFSYSIEGRTYGRQRRKNGVV